MNQLSQWLKQGIEFRPNYPPDGNSDHLPMALMAMSALGADDTELGKFRNHYASRLLKLDAVSAPERYAGDLTYGQLLAFFLTALEQQSISDLVRQYLPLYLSCLVVGAFHPLIRLGYGIEWQCKEEVAAGLASFCVEYHKLPVVLTAEKKQLVDLEAWLHRQSEQGAIRLEEQSFSARIVELARRDAYPCVIAADFDACASVALAVYRSTRNFFALHMVTATWAARICSKSLDQAESANCLGALSSSLAAAHLALGCPVFDRSQVTSPNRQLDDEHLFKYLYVCRQEFKLTGHPDIVDEYALFQSAGMLPAWMKKRPD